MDFTVTSPTSAATTATSSTSPSQSLNPPTTIVSTTTSPVPGVLNTPGAPGGGIPTVLLSAAVLAAVVSGLVTHALARRTTRIEERARVRTTLAEAFQAYADYKEFPYAIRRRRHDQPGEERIRLSKDTSQVQSRLSFYQAWTRAEDPQTGAAYNDLIDQLRKVAGASMHEAWVEPPLDNDAGMNINRARVDLSVLHVAEETFLDAAATHIKALTRPWWRSNT